MTGLSLSAAAIEQVRDYLANSARHVMAISKSKLESEFENFSLRIDLNKKGLNADTSDIDKNILNRLEELTNIFDRKSKAILNSCNSLDQIQIRLVPVYLYSGLTSLLLLLMLGIGEEIYGIYGKTEIVIVSNIVIIIALALYIVITNKQINKSKGLFLLAATTVLIGVPVYFCPLPNLKSCTQCFKIFDLIIIIGILFPFICFYSSIAIRNLIHRIRFWKLEKTIKNQLESISKAKRKIVTKLIKEY
jgi:hypothetical protein